MGRVCQWAVCLLASGPSVCWPVVCLSVGRLSAGAAVCLLVSGLSVCWPVGHLSVCQWACWEGKGRGVREWKGKGGGPEREREGG